MMDIATQEIYLQGIPHEDFAKLRATEGLVWHPYEDNGFWAVTRYQDVRQVSRNPEIFSSAIGHTNLWDLEADALEARRSLIDSDSPSHTRLRRVVSSLFTPRNLLVWEETIRRIAGELLDAYLEEGGGDWVEKVAAPLPIQVILSILGVPLEEADYMVELTNHLVGGTTGQQNPLPDDAYGNTTPVRLLPFNSPASHALFEYGAKIGEDRRQSPQKDLVTQLVFAEVEGISLTAEEFRNFFQLLIFAGNETTRTAMIHGGEAFADFPDQWQRVLHDPNLVDTAVEEVLRWATPVLHFRRTTQVATQLAGTDIAAGEKVVMWYASANRDETVFADPFTFDVGRQENDHFAFGGGGPHFCLGAFLARLEIRVLIEEMRERGICLTKNSEPVRLDSNFVHGVLSLDLAAQGGSTV